MNERETIKKYGYKLFNQRKMKRFIKWKSMIRRLLYRIALDGLRNDGLKDTTTINQKK